MGRVKKRRTDEEMALVRMGELQKAWTLLKAKQPEGATGWTIFEAGFTAGWRARALRRGD